MFDDRAALGLIVKNVLLAAQLPTTFVMEGVTMYITREAFVATLGFVARRVRS